MKAHTNIPNFDGEDSIEHRFARFRILLREARQTMRHAPRKHTNKKRRAT